MEQNNSQEIQNPSTPAPEPTPANSPMHKKSKIILWILAPLVVIALLGSGVYGFVKGWKEGKKEPITTSARTSPITPTPTPDYTEGWKTYENSDLRFSFKYPPYYELTDNYFYVRDEEGEEIKKGAILISEPKKNTVTKCDFENPNSGKITVDPNPVEIDNGLITGYSETIFSEKTDKNAKDSLMIINNLCFIRDGKNFTLSIYMHGGYDGLTHYEFKDITESINLSDDDEILNALDIKSTISYEAPEGWEEKESSNSSLTLISPDTFTHPKVKDLLAERALIIISRKPRDSSIAIESIKDERIEQGITNTFQTRIGSRPGLMSVFYVPDVGMIHEYIVLTDAFSWNVMMIFAGVDYEDMQENYSDHSEIIGKFTSSLIFKL